MDRGKLTTLGEVINQALNTTNTKNSTAVAKTTRGENIPAFLTDPAERQMYLSSDLDYKYFLVKMAELEAMKRDKFPPMTLQLWYREFIRMGWKKEIFTDQCQKVKMNKKFGSIDFNDFLSDERVYTTSEIKEMVNEEVRKKIQSGYKYFELHQKGVKLNRDEIIAAAYFASDKLQTEFEIERTETFEREIQKEMERARERVNIRKKLLRKLNPKQKLFLVNECLKEKVIPNDTSPAAMNTYMNYTEYFADLIPESIIHQAMES